MKAEDLQYLKRRVDSAINSAFGLELALDQHNSTYLGDSFATNRYVDYLFESRFTDAYEKSVVETSQLVPRLNKVRIHYRMHIIGFFSGLALANKGDFVECGVWHGMFSKFIFEYHSFEKSDKKFWLFDTWGLENSHHRFSEDIFEVVKDRFRRYPNANLVRGFVPESLSQCTSESISYLSIDMNTGRPERLALDFFWEKLVPGAVVYFDDFGWNYPELRREIFEFLGDKPEKLLHFPSGQAVLIKH